MGKSISANNRANAKNPKNDFSKELADFKSHQMNSERSAPKSSRSGSSNQDKESDGF